MSLLKISNLNAFYDNSQVLFNLTINITEGKIIALLGRNGAGKSSTFKAITGMIQVKSGSIFLKEKNLTDMPTNKRALAGIGYVPEDRQVFPEHSPQPKRSL